MGGMRVGRADKVSLSEEEEEKADVEEGKEDGHTKVQRRRLTGQRRNGSRQRLSINSDCGDGCGQVHGVICTMVG
jgi:hypothetical protein